MRVVYKEFYNLRYGVRKSFEHTIVCNDRGMIDRLISPCNVNDFYNNMLGAEYHNRPFDYFKNLLKSYVKR